MTLPWAPPSPRARGKNARSRRLVGLALLAAAACGSPPQPAAPSAAPSLSASAAPTPMADSLCPSVCALKPTATTPQAAAVKADLQPLDTEGRKSNTADHVVVVVLWREANGDSIQAISSLNDLAGDLKQNDKLAQVNLILAGVSDDPALALQARRELIDKDVKVGVITPASAKELVASLAPDRLPATYVLDRQHRPRMRFDGVPRWRSPALRPFFEGLLNHETCAVVFEAGKPSGDKGCP